MIPFRPIEFFLLGLVVFASLLTIVVGRMSKK